MATAVCVEFACDTLSCRHRPRLFLTFLLNIARCLLVLFSTFDFSHYIKWPAHNHLPAGEGKLSRMSDHKERDYSKDPEEGPIKVSYIFPNGDRYEGECGRSASEVMKRSGAGKHTSAGGVIYTGGWLEDKMHGRGTLQHPSGALYEGEFKDNMYHGTGTYTFPDGSTYKGHFHYNRLEGDGAFTDTQGRVWTGEFLGTAALGLKMQHTLSKQA